MFTKTIKDRLDMIVSHLGISGRELSRACGFSESYYSSINDGIGADKLNKILSAYPEISAQWLLTGKGDMLTSESEHSVPTLNSLHSLFETREAEHKVILGQNSEIIKQNSDIIKQNSEVMRQNAVLLELVVKFLGTGITIIK